MSIKMERVEQRAVIKYLCLKQMTPTLIHQDLVDTLGKCAVSYDVVKRWCREFKCGRQSCTDEHAGGAPTIVTTQENVKKIHDLVLQDRRVTIRQIVEDTGLSYHVIYNIITAKLDMKKLSARWVPRMLTEAHKQTRNDVCSRLLTRYRQDKENFLARFLTMDESWIHHYDVETKMQSKQWTHRGLPPPKKFKMQPSAGKVMLSVFWDARGVILVDFLQKGATITGAYYANLISKLRDLIKEKRRGKLRKGVLLHHDNAPSHTSAIAKAAIAKAGFELVEHPPYSPDLAPSDFRLFPKLKEHLRGKRFSSDNDVICAVNQWFAAVEQSLFQEALEMLEHRWEKCINLNGDYVEK
jgi:[histone H3]-lysine36 N-dimethyltransferase SETMAR